MNRESPSQSEPPRIGENWFDFYNKPYRLGILIAVVLLLLFGFQSLILGRWEHFLSEPRNFRLAVVNCLQIAFGPTAYLYIRRSALKTADALRPYLDVGEQGFTALMDSLGKLKGRYLYLTGFVFALAALFGPYLVKPDPWGPYDIRYWDPEVYWHRFQSPIIGWWLGLFIHRLFFEARKISRLAGKIATINLLDLTTSAPSTRTDLTNTALAPFIRQGLTNALMPILGLAIFSISLVEGDFGKLFLNNFIGTAIVASIALILPLQGAHRRIQVAKEEELAWCHEQIRKAKPDPENPKHRPMHLADLVAYRNLIERAREWPFDLSSLMKFGLYLFIPLVSWSGSALVNNLINAFFKH